MKIAITYPPLDTNKGIPLLSQNRQFQYFKEPTYIYPVVPACAATLLKQNGFEVLWRDFIAEELSQIEFYEWLKSEDLDILALETKTPVIKQHWQIINKIKNQNSKTKIVLFGDHVTALPDESMQNSKVDFILTGGDYDFLLLNLAKVLRNSDSMVSLEPGIYYRENGSIKNSGQFKLNHDLNNLPFIDRDLTNWKLYAYKNGNFKKTPGTYIMSGRDCWWGKCAFCSWPTLYPEFRSRSSQNVLDEIDFLINRYGVKEIMDDSGTFPIGKWLNDFCQGMIARRLNKKVAFDCNMRFGSLSFDDYALMRKAGFRLILFGLESANQKTLDMINKNLNVEQIIESCKEARKAGLFPHITIMFGYPWETYEEASKTLKLGRWLLKKGIAYTVQATIVIPYPGSKLFEECKNRNELITIDWNDYDMKQPVMKIQFREKILLKLVQGIYNVAYSPEFVIKRIVSIRDIYDLKYFCRGLNKVAGHIFDFN